VGRRRREGLPAVVSEPAKQLALPTTPAPATPPEPVLPNCPRCPGHLHPTGLATSRYVVKRCDTCGYIHRAHKPVPPITRRTR